MWILFVNKWNLIRARLTKRLGFDIMIMEISMVEERRMGLGGAPPKVGIFIRDYLREHEESYPSEIHREYKRTYKGHKTLGGRKYRVCTYNSFMTYVSKLILADLIERTDRTEPSNNPKAMALDYPERVYIRLTDKGERAPSFVWLHPLRIWYYPLDWEKVDYGEYIKG